MKHYTALTLLALTLAATAARAASLPSPLQTRLQALSSLQAATPLTKTPPAALPAPPSLASRVANASTFLRAVRPFGKVTPPLAVAARVAAFPASSGSGVYPQCAAEGDLKKLDEVLACVSCLLPDETCPRGCCGSFTSEAVDVNQAVMCAIGACCVRLMLDVGGDAVMYANEPLTAGGVDAKGMCTNWAKEGSCPMCALGFPMGRTDDPLWCPDKGYKLPKYEEQWGAEVQCASGGNATGIYYGEGGVPGDGDVVPTTTTGGGNCSCTCTSSL